MQEQCKQFFIEECRVLKLDQQGVGQAPEALAEQQFEEVHGGDQLLSNAMLELLLLALLIEPHLVAELTGVLVAVNHLVQVSLQPQELFEG